MLRSYSRKVYSIFRLLETLSTDRSRKSSVFLVKCVRDRKFCSSDLKLLSVNRIFFHVAVVIQELEVLCVGLGAFSFCRI